MTLPHTENEQLPDWDDFRLLLAVVQFGSISRAAAALSLTQPTVSRRIERLEESMRLRLIDRSHSGAKLTAEGQRIVEELNIAHGAIQRAMRSAAATRMEDVKLLMTDGMATYWLPKFLPRFFETHPEIELRVYTSTEFGAEQRGHFDLSIHYVQPTDPNLITVRLGSLHFMPYASAEYLLRLGEPESLADLGRHRLLDYVLYLIDKGTWMTRLPATLDEGRAQLFTNSSAVLCENVRSGAGIALLPTYISVYEKEIVPIDVDLRFETPFWLCYHKEAADKRAVRITIEFLKCIFDRRTMPWFAERFVIPTAFPLFRPEDVVLETGRA
jgi:molybdate transport repressor ModE-like protein